MNDHPRLTLQQQAVWDALDAKIVRPNFQTQWLRLNFHVRHVRELTLDQCAEALRRLERMR